MTKIVGLEERVDGMTSDEVKKAPLLEQIKQSDLSRVAIIGGAGVDPDGLASVEAMAAIVSLINPEAIIEKFYNGKFDRPQNRTMRELLRLNQKPVSKYDDGFFSCLISVDGPASVCPAQPDFIIDHHPKNGDAIRGEDVRPIGSCSAIMWEYCMEMGLDFTTDAGRELATALAIGICTDTREKTSETTSDLDFEAEAFCGLHRDARIYSGIKNYPKPDYYMDMLCDAWADKIDEGTCIVTYLGIIPDERVGVISDLAEKLFELDSYDTSVVIATVGGNFVGSVRTSRTSINVDEFCKTIGVGGGRRGAGKFTVIMPDTLTQISDEELLQEHFSSGFKIICHKILEITGDGIRGKPKRIEQEI